MEKKITIDEWLSIVSEVCEAFVAKLEDDGKITIMDGIALLLVAIKAIAKAYKS
jgi:hypothetical protein